MFCVYLDTLLSCLRDAGVGCHIGGSFMGAVGYADDVTQNMRGFFSFSFYAL